MGKFIFTDFGKFDQQSRNWATLHSIGLDVC